MFFRSAMLGALLLLGGLAQAFAQSREAGPAEIDDCNLPTQLVFVSYAGSSTVYRYVRLGNQDLMLMTPPAGASTAKNQQLNFYEGPSHVINCAPSWTLPYQYLNFYVRTINFFTPPFNDARHLIFGVNVRASAGGGTLSADGQGPIFFPGELNGVTNAGIVPERFGSGNGLNPAHTGNTSMAVTQTVPLQDLKTYLVEVQSNPNYVRYRVTDTEASPPFTPAWVEFIPSSIYRPDVAPGVPAPVNTPLVGRGFGFAVICPNNHCDNQVNPFRVDIWGITGGWYNE